MTRATRMKGLEMDAVVDKYTYRVEWSEEDGEHVGLCAELPGLSWLARTPEAALRGVRKLVKETARDLRSSGEPVPEPLSTRNYSGELRVRIPPVLHKRLTIEAAERKRSLNRLIVDKLSAA
jgi:predicted HicB family RNase H-like nuclease